jgi:hypothetical protein
MRSPRSRHLCYLLVLCWLIGCRIVPIELAFETLEKRAATGYENEEPGLIVVTASGETEAIDAFVSPQARIRLQQVDYDNNLVIAAFQGERPHSGFGIDVERVVRSGEAVTIVVTLDENPVGGPQLPEVMAPYHVVQIPKEGVSGQMIEFRLVSRGIIINRVVASQSQWIP